MLLSFVWLSAQAYALSARRCSGRRRSRSTPAPPRGGAKPARSPGRPVTIPTIATDMQATAISANTAARTRSTTGLLSSARPHVDPVHLHHLQALAPLPARPRGADRHLAVVPAGRQDRRARLQRRRQVDAAADHGRPRHRVRRPGAARPGRHRRPARAGAHARRDQGRPRERRGGRRGDEGAARPLQRAVDELLRRDRRRVRARAGADRRGRRLEPRHDARDRDGRAAVPARRRRRDHALRRRAPPRRARAGCCSRQPDLLLLDEPTNHLDAESVAWLERHLQDYPGTVVAITHDRYFLDNVAGWILELDRGRGIPYQGNYSGWLEQKRARLQTEEPSRRARASGRSSRSSSGCG